jgi:Suppressor of fused protein (SUFU)
MSDDFEKIWLEELVERFGEVNLIREIQSAGKPKISVFYFDDLPEEGTLTGVTCGLSNANHPDWKYGKPELIVSLDTSDHGWGLAAAYLASAFFNEKRFSYGDLFKLDDPFSNESPMNACFLFAPSFLDQEDSKFVLPDRTINLVGLYPMYEEELEIYKTIGLEDFWHSEEFDLYNTQRPPVK